MRVNTKKTKTMKVSKSNMGTVNITIEGQPVEQIISLKYLSVECPDRRWKMLHRSKNQSSSGKGGFNNE